MQVGAAGDAEATCALDMGLPMELIPGRNSYAGSGREDLRFSVLFQHKPLANALVQVWHRGDGRTSRQQLRSDAQGTVSVQVWGEGTWMVSSGAHGARAPRTESGLAKLLGQLHFRL